MIETLYNKESSPTFYDWSSSLYLFCNLILFHQKVRFTS